MSPVKAKWLMVVGSSVLDDHINVQRLPGEWTPVYIKFGLICKLKYSQIGKMIKWYSNQNFFFFNLPYMFKAIKSSQYLNLTSTKIDS